MQTTITLGKSLDQETEHLVRMLPFVVRDAFNSAQGLLEQSARTGLNAVQPRKDGEPALRALDTHLKAEVRNAPDGNPVLVLTADGTDDRGVPWARVLNVHASGVKKVSKAERTRRTEAKRHKREEAEARQDAHVREREARKRAAQKAARMAKEGVEFVTKLSQRRADRAARRAARRDKARGSSWRTPPRNPMTASAQTFEQELLRVIVNHINQWWR